VGARRRDDGQCVRSWRGFLAAGGCTFLFGLWRWGTCWAIGPRPSAAAPLPWRDAHREPCQPLGCHAAARTTV